MFIDSNPKNISVPRNLLRFFLIFTLAFGLVFGVSIFPAVSFADDDEGNNDVITMGDNNTFDISSGNGTDTITIGNNNSGNVDGGNGNDFIRVGENNLGNILGANGDDTIVVGYGNTGNIDGGHGENTIINVPPAPSANPLPGTYNAVQNISLTSAGSASIRYTTDGTVPVCSPSATGMLYVSPISILSTKTITTVGCNEGYASPVASLAYTMELKTSSADLASLLATVFTPASGASLSLTLSVTVSQNLEINTTVSGDKVVLAKDTVITRADSQQFDASTLTSSETSVGSLLGLTVGKVFEGALQWGIPKVTLSFSAPVTISIFVGTDLNGQTLDIIRSVDGATGWTTDGIVAPTCVVASGICSFQATKASYYAATSGSATPAPAPASNSGSGGGGIRGEYINGPLAIASNISAPSAPSVSVPATPVVSSKPASVVKTALASKPKEVVAKNKPKKVVPAQAIKSKTSVPVAAVVPKKASKPFGLSKFASLGRLLSRPFSFWK